MINIYLYTNTRKFRRMIKSTSKINYELAYISVLLMYFNRKLTYGNELNKFLLPDLKTIWEIIDVFFQGNCVRKGIA